MAVVTNKVGTAYSWKSSGGDKAITLTSLANAAGRGGAKGDLGAAWSRRMAVVFITKFAVAPTTGNLVEIWWAASPSGTDGTENPGGASGTDAAFSNPTQAKFLLTYIGALYCSNAIGTGTHEFHTEFFPSMRYGFPVIINNSGQALSSTAGDHEFRLIPLTEDIT